MRQTDFNNDEAVGYLADRLDRLGVEDAAGQGGRHEGDTVVIGDGRGAVVFDWQPTMPTGALSVTATGGRRGEDPRLHLHEERPTIARRRYRKAHGAARRDNRPVRRRWTTSSPRGARGKRET